MIEAHKFQPIPTTDSAHFHGHAHDGGNHSHSHGGSGSGSDLESGGGDHGHSHLPGDHGHSHLGGSMTRTDTIAYIIVGVVMLLVLYNVVAATGSWVNVLIVLGVCGAVFMCYTLCQFALQSQSMTGHF